MPWSRLIRSVPASFELKDSMLLTSWCNFGLYDLRFGSTTPVHVHASPTDKTVWAGFLMDRPDRSITARLWLPPPLAKRVVAAHQSTRMRPATDAALARAHADRI